MIGKVKIGHFKDYPAIKCHKCGMRFILIAVLGMEKDNSLLLQESAGFCPYCGHPEEKSK